MKYYAGMDIGATKIKYGIINENGVIEYTHETDSDISAGGRALQDLAIGAVRELAAQTKFEGIGLCLPGVVDNEGRRVAFAPHIRGWSEIRQAEEMEQIFGVPTCLENDVKAAALAEGAFGAGQGLESFYMITFGTYLGGALMIENKLRRGWHGIAGELGYMKFTDEIDRASGASLVELARKRLNRDDIDGRDIFGGIRSGDKSCDAVLDEWCALAAQPLSDVLCVVDPQALVVGGGISRAADILVPRLQAAIYKFNTFRSLLNLQIIPAKFGNEAGMVGVVARLTGRVR